MTYVYTNGDSNFYYSDEHNNKYSFDFFSSSICLVSLVIASIGLSTSFDELALLSIGATFSGFLKGSYIGFNLEKKSG